MLKLTTDSRLDQLPIDFWLNLGISLKGKQQKWVKPRSLFCYWAVRELGISLTELAKRLGISVAWVRYSVERGEIIARENDYQLTE